MRSLRQIFNIENRELTVVGFLDAATIVAATRENLTFFRIDGDACGQFAFPDEINPLGIYRLRGTGLVALHYQFGDRAALEVYDRDNWRKTYEVSMPLSWVNEMTLDADAGELYACGLKFIRVPIPEVGSLSINLGTQRLDWLGFDAIVFFDRNLYWIADGKFFRGFRHPGAEVVAERAWDRAPRGIWYIKADADNVWLLSQKDVYRVNGAEISAKHTWPEEVYRPILVKDLILGKGGAYDIHIYDRRRAASEHVTPDAGKKLCSIDAILSGEETLIVTSHVGGTVKGFALGEP
jgi:hypothetical protein